MTASPLQGRLRKPVSLRNFLVGLLLPAEFVVIFVVAMSLRPHH